MPGHEWTEEQKKKASESAKARWAKVKSGGGAKTTKAQKVAKVPKAPKAQKAVAKTIKQPKAVKAELKSDGIGFSYPLSLRELREHAQTIAQIASIPGLSKGAKGALDAELESSIQLITAERKNSLGRTEDETKEEVTAAPEAAPASTETKPVTAKQFSPATAAQFHPAVNGVPPTA